MNWGIYYSDVMGHLCIPYIIYLRTPLSKRLGEHYGVGKRDYVCPVCSLPYWKDNSLYIFNKSEVLAKWPGALLWDGDDTSCKEFSFSWCNVWWIINNSFIEVMLFSLVFIATKSQPGIWHTSNSNKSRFTLYLKRKYFDHFEMKKLIGN